MNINEGTDEEIFLIWCFRQGQNPSRNYVHNHEKVWTNSFYIYNGQKIAFTVDGKWDWTQTL